MIVVDEKSSARLYPEDKPATLKSKALQKAGSSAVAIGEGKRRTFGEFIGAHLIDIILTTAIFAGLLGLGGLAFNGMVYSQQKLATTVYAHNIGVAIDNRAAEIPADAKVSGKLSDVEGGAVSFKDSESGKVLAEVKVPADHLLGYPVGSFKVHGTADAYTVDFSNSKDPSTVYHLSSETDEITKTETTESKGL